LSFPSITFNKACVKIELCSNQYLLSPLYATDEVAVKATTELGKRVLLLHSNFVAFMGNCLFEWSNNPPEQQQSKNKTKLIPGGTSSTVSQKGCTR
jgi:hypothetical protein